MSVPSTLAGSSMPQCAVIGWPGQTGQVSPAASSQTVKTKSIRRAGRRKHVPAFEENRPWVVSWRSTLRAGIDRALRMARRRKRR